MAQYLVLVKEKSPNITITDDMFDHALQIFGYHSEVPDDSLDEKIDELNVKYLTLSAAFEELNNRKSLLFANRDRYIHSRKYSYLGMVQNI